MSMEAGVPCSYCTSAAVGGLCAPETDTKDLPPSVFACDFQSPYSVLTYNDTNTLSSMPDTCYTDFDTCKSNCRSPDSGADCDTEVKGNNLYYCCHNPSPGCYADYDSTYQHCPSKIVTKVDDYYYCCTGDECCNYDDRSCNTGDVCCLSKCDDPAECSYTKSGCSSAYGGNHNCQWDSHNDLCVVGV